jgi:hypothetical protein
VVNECLIIAGIRVLDPAVCVVEGLGRLELEASEADSGTRHHYGHHYA